MLLGPMNFKYDQPREVGARIESLGQEPVEMYFPKHRHDYHDLAIAVAREFIQKFGDATLTVWFFDTTGVLRKRISRF